MDRPQMGKQTNALTAPRFRIHLSTAVLLMLIAAVLLCANLRSEQYRVKDKFGGVTAYTSFGWPLSVQQLILGADPEEPEFGPLPSVFFVIVIVFNVACAVALLCGCMVACEWMIRWRESRET